MWDNYLPPRAEVSGAEAIWNSIGNGNNAFKKKKSPNIKWSIRKNSKSITVNTERWYSTCAYK